MEIRKIKSIPKISLPNLPNALHRKALTTLIDRNRKNPVSWIAAPAGFGKTTFISEYIHQNKMDHLWYQVDEGDADAASFFYFMGLAVKKAFPRVRKTLPLFSAEYLHGLPQFTRQYFLALYKRLKSPFLIVLDDYQCVKADAPFHDFISDGIRACPEGVHFVVVSRELPPNIFSKLQLEKKMTIIGSDQMRLSLIEAENIAQMNLTIKTDKKMVRKIHQKTEGWAAGFTLLLEAVNANEDLLLSDNEGLDHSAVFEFFAGEVLRRIDRPTRRFLFKIAFLPDITLPIAKKLTGENRAAQRLFDFVRRNLFVRKQTVGNQITYQMHMLFQSFLRHQAQMDFSEVELLSIRQNAANLLIEGNRFEAAANLYQDAADWDGLAQIIKDQGQILLNQGREQTLRSWLKSIPEAKLNQDPALLFLFGNASLSMDPALTIEYCEKAHQGFAGVQDHAGIILTISAALNAIVHEGRDFAQCDQWFDRLDALQYQEEILPSEELRAQASCFVFELWKKRTHQVLNESESPVLRIMAGTALPLHYNWVGDLKQSMLIVDSLEGLSKAKDLPPLVSILRSNSEAVCCFLSGEFSRALNAVEIGLKITDQTGVNIWDYHQMGFGAASALCSGDLDLARRFLSQMSSVLGRVRPFDGALYQTMAAWEGSPASR